MCFGKINYEEDIGAIKDIWLKNSQFHEEQSWETVEKEVKCKNNETYVKTLNGIIVSFIVVRSDRIEENDRLQDYIFEMFAYPRRQGIGSTLLKEIQGKRRYLYLHVKKTSCDAIKFYEKNGFQIDGENIDGTKYRMSWKIQSH